MKNVQELFIGVKSTRKVWNRLKGKYVLADEVEVTDTQEDKEKYLEFRLATLEDLEDCCVKDGLEEGTRFKVEEGIVELKKFIDEDELEIIGEFEGTVTEEDLEEAMCLRWVLN